MSQSNAPTTNAPAVTVPTSAPQNCELNLADAQVVDRKTVELVQYVTAEAGEQRKRADNALTASGSRATRPLG